MVGDNIVLHPEGVTAERRVGRVDHDLVDDVSTTGKQQRGVVPGLPVPVGFREACISLRDGSIPLPTNPRRQQRVFENNALVHPLARDPPSHCAGRRDIFVKPECPLLPVMRKLPVEVGLQAVSFWETKKIGVRLNPELVMPVGVEDHAVRTTAVDNRDFVELGEHRELLGNPRPHF
jgi:hypothetical protein